MKENNELYEKYFWQVINLLDCDSVFEEFNSPIEIIDEKLAQETNQFTSAVGKDDLNSYIYYASALLVISHSCKKYNKKYFSEIELSELGIFNYYYKATIDIAKILSEKINYDILDTLFYGFTYANYLLNKPYDNKKIVKIYEKELIIPVLKNFENDYFKVIKLKYRK